MKLFPFVTLFNSNVNIVVCCNLTTCDQAVTCYSDVVDSKLIFMVGSAFAS